MIPLPSATVATTSGFIPRRRTGRLLMLRTSTTTVEVSSVPSVAIVCASRRPRGRCSSRPPMVSIPRAAAASLAFAPRTGVSASSSDGRGAPFAAGGSVRGVDVAKAVGPTPGLCPAARRPKGSIPTPTCRLSGMDVEHGHSVTYFYGHGVIGLAWA